VAAACRAAEEEPYVRKRSRRGQELVARELPAPGERDRESATAVRPFVFVMYLESPS
jgi:hypothetical protein